MKLLCTDLDRTLLPNGAQPESALARPVLWQLLRSQDMALAYVSGRDLGRIRQAIADYALPEPDAIVADVGTSIHVPVEGDWQLDERWQSQIGVDWNGRDSDGIGRALEHMPHLQAQEPDRQTRYKRSYYLPRDVDVDDLTKQLQSRLQSMGVHASLVFSDDPEKAVQLLDILPVHATKLEAVLHIQSLLGVENSDCLFSGDSGNDVTALASHLQSVTVANADAATRQAVLDLSRHNGTEKGSYQAEGGLALAEGRMLNGNYAAGIVEGLVHFNPQWQQLLMNPDWVDEAVSRAVSIQGREGRTA